MAEKTVLLCDKCGAEGAERVRIQYQDSVWGLDLCERHRKPVTDLLKHGRESALPVPDRDAYERVGFEQLQEEARRQKG